MQIITSFFAVFIISFIWFEIFDFPLNEAETSSVFTGDIPPLYKDSRVSNSVVSFILERLSNEKI